MAEGRAERFIDVPLIPAGLRAAPDDPDREPRAVAVEVEKV